MVCGNTSYGTGWHNPSITMMQAQPDLQYPRMSAFKVVQPAGMTPATSQMWEVRIRIRDRSLFTGGRGAGEFGEGATFFGKSRMGGH